MGLRDGESGIGVKTTFVYEKAGTCTVTLTVKDRAGNTDIRSITVTVLEAFPMLLIAVA
ncbi:MAG: PKD domain-containing protein [Candidatus Brockarchaeota archaeon]|nr:PKD domain-containing protein [Candidatus Brockarchaeota archaeon]